MHEHRVSMPTDNKRPAEDQCSTGSTREHPARASALSRSGPLIEDYLADPFVFRHGQTYYTVGTGGAEARGMLGESNETRVFPLYSSVDLKNWEARGRALVRPDPAFGNTFWAPEVAYHRGVFYMYYSALTTDSTICALLLASMLWGHTETRGLRSRRSRPVPSRSIRIRSRMSTGVGICSTPETS
jgi:hypothetical protein